jgi:hypothetical protein
MAQIQGTREQILLSAYNAGYEYIDRYKEGINDFVEKFNKDAKRERILMTILGFSPAGMLYKAGKGLHNGLVGLGQGAVVLLANLTNNLVQVFRNESGAAAWSEDWLKEVGSDLLYMFASGLQDAVDGIQNGVVNFLGSAGNLVGISPEWTEKAKLFIRQNSDKAKNDLLSFGGSYRNIDTHTFDVTKDVIKWADDFFGSGYIKTDIFAPYMQDNAFISKAYEIFGGSAESIGRMIPAIAITALTKDLSHTAQALGALASSGYFYATTYGQSFNEAIEKGLSIEDAQRYASQVAVIETGTEQIGGFTFTGGIGKNIISDMLNEGMEEIIAELATSGEITNEDGTTEYERPQDFIERVLTAGFSGALSGGVMAGGNVWFNAQKYGTQFQTIEDVSSLLDLEVKKWGYEEVQAIISENLDLAVEGLNKTVAKKDKNPKNFAKTKKALENSRASMFIEFNENSNKFELTELGQKMKTDIRAKQGSTIFSDEYVGSVSPLKSLKETVNYGKGTEKVVLVKKTDSDYTSKKNRIDKIIDHAKSIGFNVVFYRGNVKNSQGYYENGISYVNINTNMEQQVAGHELIHQFSELYKKGLGSKKANKLFEEMKDLAILSFYENKDLFERVVKNAGIDLKDTDTKEQVLEKLIKNKEILDEEILPYFIEYYVNMDRVMEKVAWNYPALFTKVVNAITKFRKDKTASIIEQKYIELLKEIKKQSYDSLNNVLLLSSITDENIKYSKILEKKIYDEKEKEYSYLKKFLVKVDKNGNYILPEELKETFKNVSDKELMQHQDFKSFLQAITDKDINAIIDNFLDTKNIKDEALQKRLTGIKAATLFGYFEDTTPFNGQDLMKDFRERFVEEIDRRINAKKEEFKNAEKSDNDLVRVDAETFHYVFSLNYIKMFQENYVSLYPVSVYKSVKHLFLRDDFMAGFAVQGEEQAGNEVFGRYELGSLFKSTSDSGWLKKKASFIVKDLQARQLASVSEAVSKVYRKTFQNQIEIIKEKFQSNENDMYIDELGYSNFYMTLDWSATYNNYLISEMARRKDNPTYAFAAQIGIRTNKVTPNEYLDISIPEETVFLSNNMTPTQYEFFKNTVLKDDNGQVFSMTQVGKTKSNNPLYYGLEENGVTKSGYILFVDEQEAKKITNETTKVFANITKPLNSSVDVTIEMFNKIINKTKNIADLNEQTIKKYSKKINSGEIKKLSVLVDLMALEMNSPQDILAFKEALRAATGYDGYVFYNSENKITGAVAWFDDQIKSSNNLTLDNNEKDATLFSKMDEIDDFDEDMSRLILEQLTKTQEDMDYESEEISDTEKAVHFYTKEGLFIKVTDQELIDKGYLLKKVGYPVYLHKNHIRLPSNFMITDFSLANETITIKGDDFFSFDKYRFSLTLDYINPKTKEIIKNARFAAFGTSEYGLEALLRPEGSVGQSFALEDLSSEYMASKMFSEKGLYTPRIIVLLKNSVLEKPETLIGSTDYFTPVRKVFGDYIILFEDGVLTEEARERYYENAKEIIDKNGGVITEKIEKTHRIFSLKDPNLETKISKITQETFADAIRRAGYETHINDAFIDKMKFFRNIKDLIFLGQNALNLVSEKEHKTWFLDKVDENLDRYHKLNGEKYNNDTDLLHKAILDATDINSEEYKLKKFLLAIPYNYDGSPHNSTLYAREGKTNVKLEDIATIYYVEGDRETLIKKYDNKKLVDDFDLLVERNEKSLKELEAKGVRVVRLNNANEIKNNIFIDANNVFSKDALMSGDNISQQLYQENVENGLDGIPSSVLFSRKYNPVTKTSSSAFDNLYSSKVDIFDNSFYKILEKKYSAFTKNFNEKTKAEKNKVISRIVEDTEKRIRYNDNNEQIYNHLFVSVAKYAVIHINALLESGNKITDFDKQILIAGINKVIANTMAYIDNTYVDNDVNKLDPSNPNGYQYTKKIYWGIRNLLETKNKNHEGLTPLKNLYESIFDLDFEKPRTLNDFHYALKVFELATNVLQVSSLAIDSAGEYAHTIKNVARQAHLWGDIMLDIVGSRLPTTNKFGKRTLKRKGGIIGDNNFVDNLVKVKWIADPFTYAEIASLSMKNGLPQIIQNRLFEGSKKQLKVLNLYTEFFEGGGWLKHNREKINALEKNYVEVKNLKDVLGNPVQLAMSQVITLYNTLKREVIRERLIDAGLMDGEKTTHFEAGNNLTIAENVSSKIEREEKSRVAKVVDKINLLNELYDIIEKADKFVSDYSKKTMEFFQEMYPFVNATFKDINGLELPNDALAVSEAMKNLSTEEKNELLAGLPSGEDFSQIYIPFRNANKSYMGKGAFDVNTILDLGVFDGLAQALTDSGSNLIIDSINNLIPSYAKEVANYYGLYRVARDLNALFSSEQAVEGSNQSISLAEKIAPYSKDIITFYEELLKDIAGYSAEKDGVGQSFNKFIGKLRKNFFLATLALNVKVVATQYCSMITIGTMFGDGSNVFSNSGFMAKFIKNLFVKGSKTKAKYLIENSEIYKNRSKMAGYEVKEATKSAWESNAARNALEFLMSGITITDNMINRAFFITLTETINPETKAFFTEQEALETTEIAIERYQSSGNMISRSELLRTENEVLRLFTKFLGEPMKVITNIYGTVTKLKVIKKFEENAEKIENYIENKKVEEKNKIDKIRISLDKKIAYQNTEEFKNLPAEKQKEHAKEIKKDKAALIEAEQIAEQNNRVYDILGKNVKEVIASKAETKNKLTRLVSAFFGSLMWQVALGMGFKMLRGAGKEKPEDEEMWVYLSKMFGHQLAYEFVGYLPFIRDVYSTVANGFSLSEIDEVKLIDDVLRQMNYLITDISNGGDFKAWRHIRQFSLTMGALLGIPTRNIERLFTTPMSWFSPSGSFTYKAATGQRVNVNQELKEAVATGDEKLIEAVVKQKLEARNIKIGKDVFDEIDRLAGVNGEVISISGDYGSFTIDGEEYILTREQQQEFTEIYSRADYIASKIIKSAEYRQLNDKYKAKLLTAIFNYFYKMAKQKISGKKLIAEKNYFETLLDAYDYFAFTVAPMLYNRMINEEEKKGLTP